MNELESLESQTTVLLENCQNLKLENAMLKKQYEALSHAYLQLQEKRDNAVKKIKTVIHHLRGQPITS